MARVQQQLLLLGVGVPVIVIVIAIAGAMIACSSDGPSSNGKPSVTRVAEPEDVIDQELMIALAQAKNFHHKARVYQSDGNLLEAIAAVRQILTLKFPAGAPEADDVRNDARALLAKLLLAQGQLDEAMKIVDEGLAASQRESFFVANLYTMQGEIHEERAKQLDAAPPSEDGSNKAKANDARRAAITSFDKSIKINEALQKKLMEER